MIYRLSQNNTIKFNYPKKIMNDMTLIIGVRCKDGVIIAGDKKVVEGTNITSEEKITSLPLSIYVAGAGVKEIIDKFNERIPTILQERRMLNFNEIKKENPNINIEDVPFYFRPYEFLEDCEGLLTNLSQRYIDEAHQFWHSDILVGVIVNTTAELHHLDTLSCLDSKRRGFKCIGSGAPYAEFILKGLWDEDLSMREMAEICNFVIKEIEKCGIDNNVGEGVQIVFVPDISRNINEINKDIDKWKKELEETELTYNPETNLDNQFDNFFSNILERVKKKVNSSS